MEIITDQTKELEEYKRDAQIREFDRFDKGEITRFELHRRLKEIAEIKQ